MSTYILHSAQTVSVLYEFLPYLAQKCINGKHTETPIIIRTYARRTYIHNLSVTCDLVRSEILNRTCITESCHAVEADKAQETCELKCRCYSRKWNAITRDTGQLTECSEQRKMSAGKRLTTEAGRRPWWILRFAKKRGTLLLRLAVHFRKLYQMRNCFMAMELRNVRNRDHSLLPHKQACCLCVLRWLHAKPVESFLAWWRRYVTRCI
jgi:hypothetical protein